VELVVLVNILLSIYANEFQIYQIVNLNCHFVKKLSHYSKIAQLKGYRLTLDPGYIRCSEPHVKTK